MDNYQRRNDDVVQQAAQRGQRVSIGHVPWIAIYGDNEDVPQLAVSDAESDIADFEDELQQRDGMQQNGREERGNESSPDAQNVPVQARVDENNAEIVTNQESGDVPNSTRANTGSSAGTNERAEASIVPAAGIAEHVSSDTSIVQPNIAEYEVERVMSMGWGAVHGSATGNWMHSGAREGTLNELRQARDVLNASTTRIEENMSAIGIFERSYIAEHQIIADVASLGPGTANAPATTNSSSAHRGSLNEAHQVRDVLSVTESHPAENESAIGSVVQSFTTENEIIAAVAPVRLGLRTENGDVNENSNARQAEVAAHPIDGHVRAGQQQAQGLDNHVNLARDFFAGQAQAQVEAQPFEGNGNGRVNTGQYFGVEMLAAANAIEALHRESLQDLDGYGPLRQLRGDTNDSANTVTHSEQWPSFFRYWPRD